MLKNIQAFKVFGIKVQKNDISSKHDSYGIVKNADLTKHTGVQSKWEQGSLETDISSKHDSYGIVKNADLTKHSGVQSKWEQGSLRPIYLPNMIRMAL